MEQRRLKLEALREGVSLLRRFSSTSCLTGRPIFMFNLRALSLFLLLILAPGSLAECQDAPVVAEYCANHIPHTAKIADKSRVRSSSN